MLVADVGDAIHGDIWILVTVQVILVIIIPRFVQQHSKDVINIQGLAPTIFVGEKWK